MRSPVVRGAVALAAALLVASAGVTGCTSGSDGGGSADGPERARDGKAGQEAAQKAAPEAEAGAEADPSAGASEAPASPQEHIVRTAEVAVETEDVPGGLAEARATVRAAGGYVGSETTDRDPDGGERSRATLRVPPAEYESVLGKLSGLGELRERKVSAKDVTDQMVDVRSRIKTQQASVERVRKLMDDAEKLSDVVTLESELSTRQADLEAQQARLKSLEDRTGMATLTLILRDPDGSSGSGGDGGTSVGDALAGGWGAFVVMLRWVVIALGATLPFAAAAALLFLVWRAVRRRGGAPAATARPPGGEGPAD
ncbi:DUF4349 domain-containing protein [Streptomyces armeniacus]|uniref:DUF4349 domain-containing protein n=1 Tax=Streptomyces armeniacus TaxID=83291 RepID=A0A345XML6_9ACTN|nr:DUF4349 domain-containing protein [Streptomyces armeniacus]AXK32882.1 DUF4349 domain-containing protein [Streptomyces armeniacus]